MNEWAFLFQNTIPITLTSTVDCPWGRNEDSDSTLRAKADKYMLANGNDSFFK